MPEQFLQNPLFLALILWSLVWKGFALWRAVKRNDKVWYIIMLTVNMAGLIEIVYLLMTRPKKENKDIAKVIK